MYLSGGAQYHFLQGDTHPNYLGKSLNQSWVDGFQNPFNQNILFPAAKLATTNPAAAYAQLAPAFEKIKADSIAWINTMPPGLQSDAQRTIDGWKKDWPLIMGFLQSWAPEAAPQVAALPIPMQPLIFSDVLPPAMTGVQPTIMAALPIAPVQTQFVPLRPGDVNITAPPATGGNLATMQEWLPWIAGAAVLGFMFSGRGKKTSQG